MSHLFRPRYCERNGKTKRTAKWYASIKDATGKRKRVPLCEDKTAAKAMLADLIRHQDRATAGITARPVWPLAASVDDWRASMRAGGAKERHVRLASQRVARAFAGLERVDEITGSVAERYLVALQEQGLSIQTRNHYLASLRAFCNWCVREGRLPTNPLAKLRRGNAATDRRHDRRALSDEEFGRLLAAANKSEQRIHGLAGPDRAMLYATAAATGFRVGELAALRPSSFRLEEETPLVVCRASYAKNGKVAYQPLPPTIVAPLRAYLAGRAEDKTVWPGYWSQRAAELLQADLAAAGLPYETDDGFADFHALRALFITGLCRAGVPAHVAQALARHSTPVLTLGVYAKTTDAEQAKAVGRLALPLVPPTSGSQNGGKRKRAG